MKISTILLLFIWSFGYSQQKCEDVLLQLRELEELAMIPIKGYGYHIGDSMIDLSKERMKRGVELGKGTVRGNDCIGHDILVNKILSMEMKLGNFVEAEDLAISRIEYKNPKWRSEIYNNLKREYFEMLADIKLNENLPTYYDQLYTNGKSYWKCGTRTYYDMVQELKNRVEKLNECYSDEFYENFIRTSNVLLDEEVEQVEELWEPIHKLVVKSLMKSYTKSELLAKFEAAEIQQTHDPSGVYLRSIKNKGFYYVQLGNYRLYIKSNLRYNKNRFELFHPQELEKIKSNSTFYRTLKNYAS